MDDRFLPVSRDEMESRDWWYYDILLVTGDAYVDHPSFGAAVIGRILEDVGWRVAIAAQPRDSRDLSALGRPRLAVMVTAGNLDSMVAHYTSAKRKRSEDAYSPGGKAGMRPDRAATVYAGYARHAFGDIPVVLGGLEASLRRFAHYDYHADTVFPSVLQTSGADILVYGMGERAVLEIAARLAQGSRDVSDIRGVCYMSELCEDLPFPVIQCAPFEKLNSDTRAYAEATRLQYREQDYITGHAVAQRHGSRYLIQNPPARPLSTQELDKVAELPYAREVHPSYASLGGVPAIEEVEFSIIHNRGCFGGCSFCSLAFHQGRYISSRSHDSVVREAERMVQNPRFKGYIHDVGGPTANFRHPSCGKQLKEGMCRNRQCLAPEPCENLIADHRDYLELLRKLRAIKGVKKVFIRSGIRFDYLMADRDEAFLRELVEHHVSGQLKVAPEHCRNDVLDCMGKPHTVSYTRFSERYAALNGQLGLKQYLVPYYMSSHPGCTLRDAVALAEQLRAKGVMPEQVQDFYPTPGTLSTAMYYTGIDPRTMKPVYVPKTQKERDMQRALMQWRKPENRRLIFEALHEVGRTDLIGSGRNCLVPSFDGTAKKSVTKGNEKPVKRKKSGRTAR